MNGYEDDSATIALMEAAQEYVSEGLACLVGDSSPHGGRLYRFSSSDRGNCIQLVLCVESTGSTLFVYGGDLFVGSFELSEQDIPEFVSLVHATVKGEVVVVVRQWSRWVFPDSIKWSGVEWSISRVLFFHLLPLKTRFLSYSRYDCDSNSHN